MAVLSLTACPLPPSANFVLPDASEFLDEVIFIELQREEADALIKQYNEEGRKAGPPPDKRFDSRPGGFRGRGFQRYEHQGAPQGARGSYQNRGSPGGGGGYRGGSENFLTCSLVESLSWRYVSMWEKTYVLMLCFLLLVM